MALEELLGTEAGRAERRQLIAAIQRETDEGDAARFSRLQQAIRAQLARRCTGTASVGGGDGVASSREAVPSGRCRAIWALGNLLDLLRELGLLPEEGIE